MKIGCGQVLPTPSLIKHRGLQVLSGCVYIINLKCIMPDRAGHYRFNTNMQFDIGNKNRYPLLQITAKFHFGGDLMERLLESEGVHVKDDQVQDFKSVFWDPAVELAL